MIKKKCGTIAEFQRNQVIEEKKRKRSSSVVLIAVWCLALMSFIGAMKAYDIFLG